MSKKIFYNFHANRNLCFDIDNFKYKLIRNIVLNNYKVVFLIYALHKYGTAIKQNIWIQNLLPVNQQILNRKDVRYMKKYFIELLNCNSQLFYALLIFIIINYITSIFVMIVEKRWLKDRMGKKNILGKLGSLLLIYIAHIVGVIIVDNTALSSVVITFYLSKEGIAILDNLKCLDVPLPSIIVKILEQLNRDSEGD